MVLNLITLSPVHGNEELSEFIDTSCHISQISACEQSSNTSCTSLERAMVDYYNEASGARLSSDAPYHVFSLFDLFYSGIVSDRNAPSVLAGVHELSSETTVNHAKYQCEDILHQIRFSGENSDACRWTFTCRYNPNYFPSFSIQAKLNETLKESNCEAVVSSSLKFVKTNCLNQPGQLHWCPCDAGFLITGYNPVAKSLNTTSH